MRNRHKQKIFRRDLIRLFDYDSENGWFSWLKKRGRAKPGRRAGTFDKDGRRIIMIDGAMCDEGHLVWLMETGLWPKKNLYRINEDKGDNRFLNLTMGREAVGDARATPLPELVVLPPSTASVDASWILSP